MATCAVTGNIIDPQGTAISSVMILARVNQPIVSSLSLVTPIEVWTTTDASGNFTLTLQQSVSVIFTVKYPIIGTEPMRQFDYTGNIPAATSAQFNSVIVIE